MKYLTRMMATMVCVFAFAHMAWGQQIYKSVMPDGSVVFSYDPPSGSKSVQAVTPEVTKLGTGGVADSVTLYSATWCGYCKKAKAYLDIHGIPYTDVDIDSPGAMAELVKLEGGKSVPFLVRGKQHYKGFSKAGYDRFFAGH